LCLSLAVAATLPRDGMESMRAIRTEIQSRTAVRRGACGAASAMARELVIRAGPIG